EPSIIRRRILEKADLLTERLRINRPALGIGVGDDVKSKLRQASKPLLDGNLHVMARDTLVVGLRLVAEQFSMGIVGSSNDDASWPRSIRGAKNIVSGIVRLGGRHSFHSQRGFREHSEEFRKAWLHLANVATELLHDLIRRFRYEFRITIERGTKAAQVFVACFDSKIAEQAIDSFDLSKPERMNLRRGHICGGLLSNGL